MRSKAAILAEDIASIEEYMSFGNELAIQLNKRWGISNTHRSDGKAIDAPSILKQLENLRYNYEKVAGNAVGKGFEEIAND